MFKFLPIVYHTSTTSNYRKCDTHPEIKSKTRFSSDRINKRFMTIGLRKRDFQALRIDKRFIAMRLRLTSLLGWRGGALVGGLVLGIASQSF